MYFVSSRGPSLSQAKIKNYQERKVEEDEENVRDMEFSSAAYQFGEPEGCRGVYFAAFTISACKTCSHDNCFNTSRWVRLD